MSCSGATCSYVPTTGAVTITGLPTSLASGASASIMLYYTAPNAGTVPVTATIATTTTQPAVHAPDSASGVTSVQCVLLDKTCTVPPQPVTFTCATPINSFKMAWEPGQVIAMYGATTAATSWVTTNAGQRVDLEVWNGAIGSIGPINGLAKGPNVICGIEPGEIVQVYGLTANGYKPATQQYWEVYKASAACVAGNVGSLNAADKIGNSAFDISCSDTAMNSADDCGLPEGDLRIASGQTNLINDWDLAGIVKPTTTNTLDCEATSPSGQPAHTCALPANGGPVTYQFKVTNPSSATGSLTIQGVTDTIAGNTVTVGGPATLPPGQSITYTYGPIPTYTTTVDVATVIDTNNQCTASAKVVVTTACFLGDPKNNLLYPYSTGPTANARTSVAFNESGVLRMMEPSVATVGDTLRVWYGDEHALLLGIRQVTTKTSTGTSVATYNVWPFVAAYPTSAPVANSADNMHGLADSGVGATEAQGGVDGYGRPIHPSLFCTDITGANYQSNAGDWQQFGVAQGPDFVSGTWKSAVTAVDKTVNPPTSVITTDADPAKNSYTLGPGADPVPVGLVDEGYGAEAWWNVNGTFTCFDPTTRQFVTGPLLSGHTYRMQFMIHDGDQNKSGGDVGQACAVVTVP